MCRVSGLSKGVGHVGFVKKLKGRLKKMIKIMTAPANNRQ
jgi:hypothetical protein